LYEHGKWSESTSRIMYLPISMSSGTSALFNTNFECMAAMPLCMSAIDLIVFRSSHSASVWFST
jgi:hypothetical protein